MSDPRPNKPVDVGAQDTGRWRLLNGLSFLRVRYEEQWSYTLASFAIAILVTALYWRVPVKPALMGDLGLLKDLKDFVQVLFPFYVGALAAVATFAREGLDDVTIGGKATIRIGTRIVELTRRQFICRLFGYCAVLSIFLFVAVIIAKMVQPWAMSMSGPYGAYFKTATVFVFSLGFSHLMIISLWGIYYLSNRLAR
jgi:hypothetical protein